VAKVEPKHKGVGVVAIVKGIKANLRARAQVPADLISYMQVPILATAWYPERDYNTLITLLAASIDAKAIGGDVWAYFGRTGAQRDIGGDQRDVPERSRLENAGVYRNFRDIAKYDVAGLFLRITKVWSLYHDTGTMLYMRHHENSSVVVVRLQDFTFAVKGMADLQTAYMAEYAKLTGISMQGQCVAYSGSACEWHYELARHPEQEHSMARLAPWHPAGGRLTKL
jgi:hypothetical protein